MLSTDIAKLRHSFKVGVVAVLFLAICVFASIAYSTEKGSINGRFLIWNATTQIISSNTLFGVGYDAFQAHYMDAQASYLSDKLDSDEAMLAGDNIYAFNETLHFFAENGVVGLALAIVIAYCCLTIKVGRSAVSLKAISISSLLCIFIFGQFSYPLQILPFKLILVLALATLGRLDRSWFQYTLTMSSISFKRILILRLLIITAGGGMLSLVINRVVRHHLALVQWRGALNYYEEGKYESSLMLFSDASPEMAFNGYFLLNYGKVLESAGMHSEASVILNKSKNYLSASKVEVALGQVYKDLGQYGKAEDAYLKAIAMVPVQYYPRYLRVKLFNDTGERRKACIEAKKLLRRPVKVHSTAVEQMKAELELMVEEENALTINKINH